MEAKRVEAIALESSTNDTINSSSSITTIPEADFEIPVIDMEEPDEERLARLIAKASSENGVFQVINHGVTDDVIAKLQSVGKRFFELPEEEKEVYARSAPGSMEGYGTKTSTLNDEAIVAWCDNLVHKVWPPSAIKYEFWPKNPASYREANEEYANHLRWVSDKLFRCMSLGLGLEGHELKEAAGGEGVEYVLMINHYPPCPRLNDLPLGVPPHTDMCAMTLLVPNEVPGLQLCKDDHWYDVKYVPNAIVIHIGDQLEIISNGKYKSILHRTTVDEEKTRMSWPVFLNPPQDLTVGPIPTLINEEKPAKYKSKKYGDYVYCKMNGLPQ